MELNEKEFQHNAGIIYERLNVINDKNVTITRSGLFNSRIVTFNTVPTQMDKLVGLVFKDVKNMQNTLEKSKEMTGNERKEYLDKAKADIETLRAKITYLKQLDNKDLDPGSRGDYNFLKWLGFGSSKELNRLDKQLSELEATQLLQSKFEGDNRDKTSLETLSSRGEKYSDSTIRNNAKIYISNKIKESSSKPLYSNTNRHNLSNYHTTELYKSSIEINGKEHNILIKRTTSNRGDTYAVALEDEKDTLTQEDLIKHCGLKR